MSSVVPLRPSSRRLLLALAIAAAPFASVIPASLHAAEIVSAQIRFDIAPGKMTDALNRFASTAGITLSFDPDAISNLSSDGLQGSFSVDEALHRLLSGSSLQAQRTNSGAYLVVPAPAQPKKVGATLSTVKVSAASLDDSTEGTGSYTAHSVSAGNKVGAALREIPRSVSVIARQQLDDQRITTLDEVVDQMPGVTIVPGGTGYAASAYYSRGFQITSVMVDGSPAASWSDNDTSGNSGMSKYDSVQLLRGPDGVFSGNGQPSGSVNLVRKRPLDSFQLKYALSAGSWNNYFGELDVTDKLVDSGRIRGRFVAAFNDREFFFNGADRDISTVFGTVAADLADTTTLTVGITQDKDRGSGRDMSPGFPRYADGSPIPIPRDQGYTDWSYKNTESINYFATLDHTFNEQWTARVNVVRAESESATGVSSYNGATSPTTGLGSYLFQGTWATSDFSTTAIDAHISGKFEWLERTHRVVLGADNRDSNNDTALMYSRGAAGRGNIIDWSNTDPDQLLPRDLLVAYTPSWLIKGETNQQGAYFYGDFQVYGPLNVVVGGRYSSFEVHNAGGDTSGTTRPPSLTTNDSHGNFTPYYALKYTFSSHWTAYFTTAESFEDQSLYYTADDKALDPVLGRSYELGLKGEHWDGKLNTNVTVYRSRRDNFAVRISQPNDFDVPGKACCYVGDGQFLAQGVELEISGQITPQWQINGGYTYDDNETEYGNNDGLRYASYTPEHMFRVWSRYDLSGDLSRWSVGGGVKTQSSFFRSGTVATWDPNGGTSGTGGFTGPNVPFDFVEPGRAVWNAFAEYRPSAGMSVALNINNLFDKHYFRSVLNTNNGNVYGEPRSISLTLRGTFD